MIKEIRMGYAGCSSYSITFPNGKKVVLSNGKGYVTGDPEELEFAAKQRFILITDVSDKDYKIHTYDPKNLPSILRDIHVDSNFANAYKWSPKDDELIRAFLKKIGYEVMDKRDRTSSNLDTDELISMLQSRGYAVYKKHETVDGKEFINTFPDVPATQEEIQPKQKMSMKELRYKAKEKSINSFGKSYEVLYKEVFGDEA